MRKLKNKKIIFSILIFVIAIIAVIGFSYSEVLENDVEVEPDTNLTYYLDVTYDGVDRNGVESNDDTTAAIHSGYIDVSDKIPDGLSFVGFVTTSDGSIGAVQRNDENTSCLGRVVDDTKESVVNTTTCDNGECYYHGLHYSESTRTVTFKVKNLKAGCKLTIGIITRTPAEIDDPNTPEVEQRRDFYNFGTAKEDSLTVSSNTVHAYMGRRNLPLHNVTYSYTGEVPSNAPTPPIQTSYAENTKVGVAGNVEIEGYEFSGWDTSDVTVTRGSFTMPNSDVALTGSFDEIEKNSVIYEIDGTIPEGYVKPSTKEYYPNANVYVDSLKAGTVFNGYRFLGWETSDVTIEDDGFVMPDHNVTIRGRFEEVTYTVTYLFYDTVLPPNSDNYLPAVQSYKPGVTVTHPTVTEPEGYKFLGWYKENNFVMPSEDVTIYGEWKVQNGTFEPTISKVVTSTKDYYNAGDVVTFKVTITNTASFAIHDVMVKENNENAHFAEGTGYSVVSDHMAKVDNIAAGASIDLTATYTVSTTDVDKVINEVELLGALADNHYELADKEYKATAEFNVHSNLVVHHYLEGGTTKVAEDEISEIVYGTRYNTSSKASDSLFDDYKNDYEYNNNHDGDPINGVVNKKSIEVIYYYQLKKGNVTVHYYIDGTTDSLCADVTSVQDYRSNYEAHTCTNLDSNYQFKNITSTDNNSVISNTDVSGNVKQDNIVINYYYELKPAIVITHHKEYNTNTTLASDVETDYKYGNHYTTSVSNAIPSNYEFHSKTNNFEGTVNADRIEVTYYYQKKDSNLTTTITKSGTEEITNRNDLITYNIKYNATVVDYIGDGTITITDILPYKIDSSASELNGGVYNDANKTITWTENWTGIDSYNNKGSKEITKTIQVKYLDFPSSGVINNRVSGKIVLSNNTRTIEGTLSTNIKLPGKITVHHYKAGTTEKLSDDVITIGVVPETYISKAIDLEGYVVSKRPQNETINYTEEDQEIIYEYERIKFNIITKVVGGVGTITGDEIVYYGENSTPNNIVITPADKYEIIRVIVNDVDAPVTNKEKMILGSYKNVKENIIIQVEFKEIPAPVPITGSNSKYYIIGAILLIFSLIILKLVVFDKKNKVLK